MNERLQRRSFTRGLLLTPLATSVGGLSTACSEQSTDTPLSDPIARRDANAMSAEEIDRFVRAFEYAVREG